MTAFPKNKFLLSVAFLATIALVFYRLHYDGQSAGFPLLNSLNESTQKKQNPPMLDKSSLLLKKQQRIIPNSTSGISAVESSAVSQNQNSLVSVSRVIDGDTIVVRLNSPQVADINGQDIHVRLIGINSPELNDKRPKVACLAQKAKGEAEKILDGSTSLTTGGQKIYLEKDLTQGDYDKYGRLLAYVFLSVTSTQINFNQLMIEEGYAYEYTYNLPYKYQSEFKDAQNKARTAQKGLWGNEICNL